MKTAIDFNDWDIEEGEEIPIEFNNQEVFYNFLIKHNVYDKWTNIVIQRFGKIEEFLSVIKPGDYIRALVIRSVGAEKLLWKRINNFWLYIMSNENLPEWFYTEPTHLQ